MPAWLVASTGSWSIAPDPRCKTVHVTHQAPPLSQRTTWVERQVRAVYGQGDWELRQTYDAEQTQRARQQTAARDTLEVRPPLDFLEAEQAEAQQGFKSKETVLLGGTGLGLVRFPTADSIDHRFRTATFSYRNDDAES